MGEEETEKYARMFACALPHVDFPMGFPASPISAHNMNLMPTDYQHGFDQLAKTVTPTLTECIQKRLPPICWPRQKGLAWCSLSIIPSKFISSWSV